MMKYIFYLLIVLAAASIIFNATKLDLNKLFYGDSQIALISIIAALCMILLSSIVLVSYKIKEKQG